VRPGLARLLAITLLSCAGPLCAADDDETLDKLSNMSHDELMNTHVDADAGDPEAKLEILKDAVDADPANDDTRYDYVKALLLAGRADEARRVFEPVAGKAVGLRKLEALQRWFDALDTAARGASLADADAKIAANKRDFEARFARAQLLIAQQQWTAAMDELLEILMRDKAWNEELARKTYIAILEIIELPKAKVADGVIPADDPVVATYRRRLSSVVLS
jgi:putative thioredoxin